MLKAACNYCPKKRYAYTQGGSTSTIGRHILKCEGLRDKMARNAIQRTLELCKINGPTSGPTMHPSIEYNQGIVKELIAKMICVHEYPLSIVDHAGFRKFCGTLQPMFKVVSRNTIRQDIINMFGFQKNSMVKYFAKFENRVAITTDLWTAGHQKRGYMAVTAHYIDASWKLKS